MTWDRNTPWRQGSVLSHDGLRTLGISAAAGSQAIALIVSHDCDLAQPPETEPNVELIVANQIAKTDGNLTHAKNARRLHLPLLDAGREITLELSANRKLLVPKTDLQDPFIDDGRSLQPKDRHILQTWLALRYRRAAFPNAFENRLRSKKLHEIIQKIMKPRGHEIIAIFFDVDRGASVERKGETDLHELDIILLYSTDFDSAKAEAVAEAACEEMTKAFTGAFFDAATSCWKDIELSSCTPVSAEEMTYAVAQKLQKWNLDYLSLRTDPQAETLI
jgi:hypothetical protein